MMRRRSAAVGVVGVMALGLALRLLGLEQIPAGIHPDEAYNALDALDIVDGARPVFLAGNNGREPLFMYLMALAMGMLGTSVGAIRLPAAVGGALVVGAQYLMVSGLPLARPRVTGLLSALLVATMFWPVAKGHQALRAGMLPLWIALALWAWWRAVGWDKGRAGGEDPGTVREGAGTRQAPWETVGWAALAGVAVAAGVYTHLNARLLPVVLAIGAVWVAARERQRRPLGALAVAGGVAGLLALPLMGYFVANPEMVGYRAGQVSILNPAVHGGDLVGALARNGAAVLGMFHWRGTTDWVENLPGRPVFDPLMGVLFVVGVGLLGRDVVGRRGRAAQGAAVLIGATLGVMLAPSWLSDGAPHYGRLTGTWPVVFFLPAWGLERVATWLAGRGGRAGRAVSAGVVTLALGVSVLWSAVDFFVHYPEAQQAHAGLMVDGLARGRRVATVAEAGTTYVTPALWSQPAVRLVNRGRDIGSFDPRTGLVLPAEGDARYVYERWELGDAEAVRRRWGGLTRIGEMNGEGTPLVVVYEMRAEAWPAPARSGVEATVFGERIGLLGYRVEPARVTAGGVVTVVMEWLALAPTETEKTLFVHVVGEGERMVGQTDGPPLGGTYPTTVWRVGERVLQRVEVKVAEVAPAGPVVVRVGWYDGRTGERLEVAGDEDAAVEVGRVEVEGK